MQFNEPLFFGVGIENTLEDMFKTFCRSKAEMYG